MPSRLTVVLVSLVLTAPIMIYWLWLVILPASVDIQCPEECTCELEGYFVNCSFSRLNSIPSNLPKHVRRLILDHNNIPFFAKDTFVSKGLVELEVIEANFCTIKKIELGAFNGLPKLTQVSMQSNQICEIIPLTFEKNCRLEYLHLANNRIERLEVDVFNGLLNLEHVYLQENILQYLHPDTFFGLPNLKFLYLSNNSDLQIPTDLHFINSLPLKHLGVSFCNIRSVSLETFAKVASLEQLDLSYNYLRSLDINILKVLQKLSLLNLTRNEISEIIPGTFEMVNHLKNLDLSHNRIGHLEVDMFFGLVNLKYIYLQGNKLQYLHPDTFVGLQNLQKLYLFKNFGLHIPNDRQLFDSLSLKHLGLSGCNIRLVSIETFANVRELEWLDLSYNYLRNLDINILKLLTKLTYLNLKSNEIIEIKPGTCDKISHLVYLNLENNKIEHLETDVFCGFVNLKYIDLKGNNLQYFHQDAFFGLQNLQKLLLSQNYNLKIQTDRQFIKLHSLKQLGLSGCNISSVSIETFANVLELEWLDLSYNYLRSLDINILKLLPKLTYLNLNSNEIIEIKPGTYDKISLLEYLYLENNKIEHLEIDVFCGFVYLKSIDLTGNKLQYFHPDTFVELQNLKTLILSHNNDLQVPTDRHFINSHFLKQLGISNCNIRSVSAVTFANVSELEWLDLGYNNLKSLDINILKVLPQLSIINLGNNEINVMIPETFGNNRSLNYLDLDNNKSEHLGNNIFFEMVNLKVINLELNKLHYLHVETFLGLSKLEKLYLSENIGLHIPTDRHFVTSLSLKLLVVASCNISSVSVETFANVSALERLDLSYNYLKTLDINILKALPKLSHLYLESNQISEIIPGTLEKNSFLEYLDLEDNKIEHLRSDVFNGLVNLQYINLKFNKLEYLQPETFIGLPNNLVLILLYNYGLQVPTDRHFINSLSLKKLAIAGCNISSVSVETFTNVSELEWLDLSYNYLKTLDINMMKALPKLTHLYLKGNQISKIIPGTLEKKSFLQYLDLRHNKIEHLRNNVFNGLVNLQYIKLEFNRLQYFHPETFVGLPYFEVLDLSLNFGLQVPTDRHFISSHSLKYLDISGCNVSSVSVESFANISALQLLDLSINNLKGLDIHVLKALPQLSALYLYGNPLQCDCQLQEVWRWCHDYNIETAVWGIVPKCYTPSEVEGIWWGVLEKGQCTQGNIHFYGDYLNTRYSYTKIEDTDLDTDTKTDLKTESVMWETFYSFLDHYKLPLSAILFTFGTTGNVILIIIITCNKDMRTAPNMYILNVAISDIIYLTVFFLPKSVTFIQVDIWCIYNTFCCRMSVILTAYSIAVFSFQRYRVTVYPLQVRSSSQPTWRVTGATICGMWIVAALFTIPSARTKHYCGAILYLWFKKYYPRVVIFRLLVSCVLPLCVIAFCYVMTSRHLLKSRFSLSETQHSRQNTRKNTAKVVLGLTVVFLFTSVPFHIYETYSTYRINLEKPSAEIIKEMEAYSYSNAIWSILYVLLSINSCLNPVALFITGLAFRRHLKRYLTCCYKTKSPHTDFELTRRN